MTFWKTKKLHEMNKDEWESLCDGCGRCCLNKVEYEDIKRIYYTDAACRLLDHNSCKCSDYPNRKKQVKDCIKLSPTKLDKMSCLPQTCAYRRLHEGRDLADWHPLISKNPDSVHEAGISVRGRVVSETEVEDLEEHIVSWIKSVPS